MVSGTVVVEECPAEAFTATFEATLPPGPLNTDTTTLRVRNGRFQVRISLSQ